MSSPCSLAPGPLVFPALLMWAAPTRWLLSQGELISMGMWEGYIVLLAQEAFNWLEYVTGLEVFVLPVLITYQQPIYILYEKRQLGTDKMLIQLAKSKSCGCRTVRGKRITHIIN